MTTSSGSTCRSRERKYCQPGRRLRARPDGRIAAHDARALVAVALGDDRGSRPRPRSPPRCGPATECSLNASRPKRAISFVTRSFSTSCSVFTRLDRLERRRDVDERVGREGGCGSGSSSAPRPRSARRRSARARPPRSSPRSRSATCEAVLGGQLPEQPRDLGRRQRPVEADRRERADVAGPVPAAPRAASYSGMSSVASPSRGTTTMTEPADLHPPAGRQHHVLRQPQEGGVDARCSPSACWICSTRVTPAPPRPRPARARR